MAEVSFSKIYHDLNEIEKKLLLMRMKGQSYSAIYEYSKIKKIGYGETRIKRLINQYLNVPKEHYVEEKYQEVFSEFSWDYRSFKNAFNELHEVYLYLDYKYLKGKNSVPKYLKKKDVVSEHFNFMGVTIDYSISNFVALMLYQDYSAGIFDGKTSKQLLKKVKENGQSTTINQIEKELTTNADVLRITNEKYLYFDRKSLAKKRNTFAKAFNKREGIHSFESIFKESKQLYESLGIMNPIMLSDLVSKCRSELRNCSKYKVLSYPYVLFGDISKKDFFDKMANKYHRMRLEEASQKIAEEYGIDYKYVHDNLKFYNKEKIDECENLNRNKILLTENQTNLLKKRLVNMYYTLEEFELIIKKVKANVDSRFFYSEEICKLGYRREYDYFISNEIIDIKQYIEKSILSHNFIKFNKFEKTDSLYKCVVEELQKSFKLIRLSDTELITSKKLRSIGIYKKDIDLFIKEVQMIYKNEFFTIKSLLENMDNDFISFLSFGEPFYESIFEASIKINSFTIEGNKLYCFDSNMSNRKMFLSAFLDNVRESICIYDLCEKIKQKYGFKLSEQTLKSISEENGFYYSDVLRKVFRDKRIYLNEVFGNV